VWGERTPPPPPTTVFASHREREVFGILVPFFSPCRLFIISAAAVSGTCLIAPIERSLPRPPKYARVTAPQGKHNQYLPFALPLAGSYLEYLPSFRTRTEPRHIQVIRKTISFPHLSTTTNVAAQCNTFFHLLRYSLYRQRAAMPHTTSDTPKSPLSPVQPKLPVNSARRPQGHRPATGRSASTGRLTVSVGQPLHMYAHDFHVPTSPAKPALRSPIGAAATTEVAFMTSFEGDSGEHSLHLADMGTKTSQIVALTSALHLWLQQFATESPKARAAVDTAEDCLRLIKTRKCPAERVVASIVDVINKSGDESPRSTQQLLESWRYAATSLINVIVTLVEKSAAANMSSTMHYANQPETSRRDSTAPRCLQMNKQSSVRRRSIHTSELHMALKTNEVLRVSAIKSSQIHIDVSATASCEVCDQAPPQGPLLRTDSMVSLASLAANAEPPTMSTLTAFMNDDFDDGSIELNQYVLFEKIGQGAQGEVFLASDTMKNELCAIKAVRRPRGARIAVSPSTFTAVGAVAAARQRQRDQLEREVLAMKKLRHRNVVRLYEVIDDPELDRMYLVMQYVEHGPVVTLTPKGVASRTIEPKKMVSYARQICAGLEYLHKKGVIHRDIKPDNILLGRDDCVYLADFGTAEVFGEADAQRGVTGTCGTMAFLAPELLALLDDGSKDSLEWSTCELATITGVNGEAVDVWALGVTFYVMLYGKLPWEFDDARQLFKHIESSTISFGDLSTTTASSPHPDFSATSMPNAELSITASPRMLPAPQDLPNFTADASTMDVESDDELLGGESTTPLSSQQVQSQHSLNAEWRRVLTGMLQRVPARRSTLRDVRRLLAAMTRNFSVDHQTGGEASANPITTVHRG
jgi:serine/threonine protein kinase